jgi:hypothetical protein
MARAVTALEQIIATLALARAKGEPLRVRIPFGLYDYNQRRGYTFLRGVVWNMQLPSDQTTPESVEQLIQAIGECLVKVTELGSAEVLTRLQYVPPPGEAPAP